MTFNLKNKVVLITGGTGSFGQAALSRFLKEHCKKIIIFSRDEAKQNQMRYDFKNRKITYIIGDIRNSLTMDNVTKNVDVIFHAAALKQVPACEFFPDEAVQTNIIGTKNLIDSSIKNKVKKVIFLSTDKAVYPINAMGMSKALGEKLISAYSRQSTSTTFCSTRYGNVLGSRGSILPLFVKQIKNNEPITITNKDMTRFIMTLDECIDLVLYAIREGKNGYIYVKKSRSVKVTEIAKGLKKILGKKIKDKIIGIRGGEKLHEILVSKEEMLRAAETKNFFEIEPENKDINFDKFFIKGEFKKKQLNDYSSFNSKKISFGDLIRVLKKNIK